ncbi:MAG: transporter substrate-binding domain-containing protein [Bifidobacteriaceae bacterium]|jgi:polar amino acid transport system substrate-binding protein|nr:transporter substrate-binding domain-containing protein [Bifidobacteriaceae bacterium]
MKQLSLNKVAALPVLALALSGLLVGCGNDSSASASGDGKATTSKGEEVEVTNILIGTGAGPKPYLWQDDDGNLTGYDYEVVQAIDEYLPEYTFEYEVTEFASIFTGIDSGRYQMGDNNITKKPEREEKYLFGKEPYVYNWTVVVLPTDSPHNIESLEDLGGLKTFTGDGGGFAQLFYESFNAAHPDNPIETVYTGAEQIKQLTDLADGVVDFSFLEIPMFDNFIAEYSDLDGKLKYVQLSQEETQQIQDPYGWFIFAKNEDGQKLADRVDEALVYLAEQGTLVELSEEFFGFDMTGR